MVKRLQIFFLVFACLCCSQFVLAQTIQLFQEDFNSGNNTFTLNSGGPAANAGSNQWVVNNNYNGGGVYPNTTQENVTAGGTIAQAPTSPYLHVYDAQTPAYPDCNYNNANVSDNFAYMSAGMCTEGLTNVKFTFFYLAEGAPQDFGRVYYSIDGGASWIQCGAAQYSNTTVWTYEIITDPAFANQLDLRFGFRWTNAGAGGANHMSFGIDDIIAVGDYDVNNPDQINVTVTPNPVCQGGNVIVSYTLSYPLCDGTYEVELSNSAGNFAGTNLGVFTIPAGQTSGAVSVGMPSTLGNCFKIRVSRVSPPPVITGVASGCIQIIQCPNTITTLQPAVTLGPDTLCNQSVIDVPFYSTGSFNANNVYTAQLSDANGNFTTPYTLGTLPSSSSYDPTLGSPPGTVSGLVPGVPPGCNYYIRVVSSSPNTIPPPANYFGPFCIRECDVTTNNMQDIHACITPYVGEDTTITIHINSWNTNTNYGAGNQFQVQVLNSQFYTVINTDSLGSATTTGNGTVTLHIPGLIHLINLLGYPGTGMYYIRLIATNANGSFDTLGTLVRLIIGSPDSLQPIVTPSDSVLCAGSILGLTISPYNYQSQYQWFSPALNNGQPFYWNYNPLQVQFNPNTAPGPFWFTVRENNNGCWSPWSDTVTVHVIGVPNVNITGSSPVCVGDTVHFHVPFLDATYYQWSSNGGVITDTANNEIWMVFDSTGTYQIHVFALNMCGSNTGNHNITVQPRPDVHAGNDVAVCAGTAVSFTATGTGGNAYSWQLNNVTVTQTPDLFVTADTTVSYVATLANTIGCKDYDTVTITVHPNPDVAFQTHDISCVGLTDGSVTAQADSGTAPFLYHWDNNMLTQTIDSLDAGAYSVTVTDAFGCTAWNTAVVSAPGGIGVTMTVVPVTYGHQDGSATAMASGGTQPYNYVWSTTPQTSGNTITNVAAGVYTVTVTDAEGCETTASVTVPNAENQLYVPNAFSPNDDGYDDLFDFIGVNLANAHVQIYDRWGEKVFESNSLKDKWDGTFKDVPVPVGVYVYYIEAKFLDGATKNAKGNVTLMR